MTILHTSADPCVNVVWRFISLSLLTSLIKSTMLTRKPLCSWVLLILAHHSFQWIFHEWIFPSSLFWSNPLHLVVAWLMKVHYSSGNYWILLSVCLFETKATIYDHVELWAYSHRFSACKAVPAIKKWTTFAKKIMRMSALCLFASFYLSSSFTAIALSYAK